jgi:hypothetical protein
MSQMEASGVRVRARCVWFPCLERRNGTHREIKRWAEHRQKIILLVNALARLHNFCIGELPEDEAITVPEELNADTLNIMNHEGGYVKLEAMADITLPNLPLGLMHGGEHFDDLTANERRRRKKLNPDELTPRQLLHDRVLNSHMKRPLPRNDN